jgi:hypothetical protein
MFNPFYRPRQRRVYFKDLPGKEVTFKFVKLFALYQESINLKEFTDVVHYIQRMGIDCLETPTHTTEESTDKAFYASKRIIKFRPESTRDVLESFLRENTFLC